MDELLALIRAQKSGDAVGIASVCSAHPLVLEAALQEAKARGDCVLIEATCNQVNPFGGYTGLTPRAFVEQVASIASRVGMPMQRVLLGGDHLGPNPWKSEAAVDALEKATRMVSDYVLAGFRKIHLDCSMACAGDAQVLPDALVARRAAQLCLAAEGAWRSAGGPAPVYVIGTEVPTPGGATEDLDTLAVTSTRSVEETLRAHREAFAANGLQQAWPRVIALVVQPGVEFDHHRVVDYVPRNAAALRVRIESEAGLVYEAHSTDYQTPALLRALVADHFAILKVGPALTFALREAFWALDELDRQWHGDTTQSLRQTVLRAMRSDPRHWQPYYTDEGRREFDMQFSLSDRIRYYWPLPEVVTACEALFARLGVEAMPASLLSQYLPRQYESIRSGALENDARAVVVEAVAGVLRDYAGACGRPGAGLPA
jgi:D-tagatose-1,6-bisphosphate aldolase subunit GatZ/KbaZ